MWTCPHCGNQQGMIIEDQHLSAMLCMHPDCGRVDQRNKDEIRADPEAWAESDL